MAKISLNWLLVGLFFVISFVSQAESYSETLEEIRFYNRLPDHNDEQLKQLIEQALVLYPNQSELYMERADFYSQKKDYPSELVDYLTADTLGYDNKSYLYMRMASVYSLLDENDKALSYGQKVVDLSPRDEEAYGQLLWYYLKLFKLEEGEQQGLQALQIFPNSLIINSMQAIILMGLYKYNEAQYFFNNAINLSLNHGQYQLAAMNLYNQFLLENNFYNYAEADETLKRALNLAQNSSNYRLWGELLSKKLAYSEALEALNKGNDLEAVESSQTKTGRTPLNHLALAELELKFGNPRQAKELLDEATKLKNSGWMSNFGVNNAIYLSNLYALYQEVWQQMALYYKVTLKTNSKNGFVFWLKQQGAKFYSFYYHNLLVYYKLQAAHQFSMANNKLASYQYYAVALKNYRGQLTFVTNAWQVEQTYTPKANVHYRAITAFIKKDKQDLQQVLNQFDPLYEKSDKQEALINLLQLGNKKEKREYTQQLYDLNPAITRLYRLPVQLNLDNSLKHSKLKGYLKQSFIEDKQALFHLNIEEKGDILLVHFYRGKLLVFSQQYPYNRSSETTLKVAMAIIKEIYSNDTKAQFA